MVGMVKAFITEESGATAIEYALIGTLIAIALIASATVFGDPVVVGEKYKVVVLQ